jgi:hypothetical protein
MNTEMDDLVEKRLNDIWKLSLNKPAPQGEELRGFFLPIVQELRDQKMSVEDLKYLKARVRLAYLRGSKEPYRNADKEKFQSMVDWVERSWLDAVIYLTASDIVPVALDIENKSSASRDPYDGLRITPMGTVVDDVVRECREMLQNPFTVFRFLKDGKPVDDQLHCRLVEYQTVKILWTYWKWLTPEEQQEFAKYEFSKYTSKKT